MTTQKEYADFLAKVAEVTKLDALVPDQDGLVGLRVEDTYTLNLQHIENSGKILCFVEVTKLPKDADKTVYRNLLVAGLFGTDTGGGYFAVEPESETVVYNYLFDFDPATADPEAFAETLEQILSLVDIWAARIRDNLAEAEEASLNEAVRLGESQSAGSFFINP